MQTSKYSTERLIPLIEWLIDEVISSSGDGDSLWYSPHVKVSVIKDFIIEHKLMPKCWGIVLETEDTLVIGENQEGLIITNDIEQYKNVPSWVQAVIRY